MEERKRKKKQVKRRIMRKRELLTILPLSEDSIWRKEKLGQFPKRIQLGDNSVGWFEDEIEAWLEELDKARDPRLDQIA